MNDVIRNDEELACLTARFFEVSDNIVFGFASGC